MLFLSKVTKDTTVLIKNKRGNGWNGDGLMDMYQGRLVTIKKIFCRNSDNSHFLFSIYKHIDDVSETPWAFGSNDIEAVVSLPFKVGDIVTYKRDVQAICQRLYKDTTDPDTLLHLNMLKNYTSTNVTSLSLVPSEELRDNILLHLSFLGKIKKINKDGTVIVSGFRFYNNTKRFTFSYKY